MYSNANDFQKVPSVFNMNMQNFLKKSPRFIIKNSIKNNINVLDPQTTCLQGTSIAPILNQRKINGIRDNLSPMKTIPQFQNIDLIGSPGKFKQIFNTAGNESLS